MKRKKGFDKSILLLILIFLLVGSAVFFFIWKFRTDEMTNNLREEQPFAVAFLVTSENELLFTEILFYHPGTQKGAILDVPGNTGIIIESLKKIDRIDALFSQEKTEIYLKRIESLIDFEIPYYIKIDIDAVSDFVDLLEGVHLFIASPVEEINEEEMVLLPSGSIYLDGAKVKTFLTFTAEDGDGDFEVTNRQHKFLQSLLNRIGEKADEIVHNDFFPYVSGLLETNLEKKALKAYLLEMKNLDVELLVFQRVLGVDRGVDEKILLFPHYDGKLLKETMKQTADSLATSKSTVNASSAIKIEILNGTNRNGLASRTAELFKSYGFEVMTVSNAEDFDYEKTTVIGRTEDINKAQKVASLIDCNKIRSEQIGISAEEDGAVVPAVDVTLILGKDFDGRYCKE